MVPREVARLISIVIINEAQQLRRGGLRHVRAVLSLVVPSSGLLIDDEACVVLELVVEPNRRSLRIDYDQSVAQGRPGHSEQLA